MPNLCKLEMKNCKEKKSPQKLVREAFLVNNWLERTVNVLRKGLDTVKTKFKSIPYMVGASDVLDILTNNIL